MGQALKTVEEQAGAEDQHEGRRDLGHDERVTRAALPHGSTDRTIAWRERGVQIQAREECGSEAEDDRGHSADDERERAHPRVELDRAAARQIVGRHPGGECAQRPHRQHETCGGSREREQESFDQELPHQGRAPSAERGANRELTLSTECPRQQEVGHVRAAEQQHEDRSREEEVERAPVVTGMGFPQR